MRRILPLLAVLMLVATPAFAAAAKSSGKKEKQISHPNWPTEREIAKAQAKARWRSDHKIKTRVKDKLVEFTPADLDFNDEEIAAGVIFGVLDTNTQTRDLAAGRYHIYIRKELGAWQAFFIQGGKAVDKSPLCIAVKDDADEPRFIKNGGTIWYWYLQVEW